MLLAFQIFLSFFSPLSAKGSQNQFCFEMSSKLEDLQYLLKTIVLNLPILELYINIVFIPSELEGLIVWTNSTLYAFNK